MPRSRQRSPPPALPPQLLQVRVHLSSDGPSLSLTLLLRKCIDKLIYAPSSSPTSAAAAQECLCPSCRAPFRIRSAQALPVDFTKNSLSEALAHADGELKVQRKRKSTSGAAGAGEAVHGREVSVPHEQHRRQQQQPERPAAVCVDSSFAAIPVSPPHEVPPPPNHNEPTISDNDRLSPNHLPPRVPTAAASLLVQRPLFLRRQPLIRSTRLLLPLRGQRSHVREIAGTSRPRVPQHVLTMVSHICSIPLARPWLHQCVYPACT
jgi:hypothetical protein